MVILLLNTILITFSLSILPTSIGWKNGPVANEFSNNPENPEYGTHDWIAEHALDWRPMKEKRYILDNLETYLYGTELPDRTTGPDAIGDIHLQHYYINESEVLKDYSAGTRAFEEYKIASDYLNDGEMTKGVLHLGIMTHYLADLAVFGNVMNKTYWGTPIHYQDYMGYVNNKTTNYTSPEFDSYLNYLKDWADDERLFPDDAAWEIAQNTTFEPGSGGYRDCTWMDANYNWANSEFKDRCGESLNFAINIISGVIHSFWLKNITVPSAPQNLAITKVEGHSINLTWTANTEKNLAGYVIFINKTGSTTEFEPLPIKISSDVTKYSYTGLADEVKYYFKIQAFNKLDKFSPDSNIVTGTTLDVTPPPIPSFNELRNITNNPEIIVSGRSFEKGALIEIFMNNDFSEPAYEIFSDLNIGLYTVQVTLVEGNNNITVRAVDDSSNPSAFTETQLIVLDTIRPTAEAGKNIEIGIGSTPIIVQFDASNSTDDKGTLINYTWILDYQYQVFYLYGTAPDFTFDKAGEYKIWLNVTDWAENWDEDYFWVNITQLDIYPPKILERTPDIDDINVSVNITIMVKFNEPLVNLEIKLISEKVGELQIPRPKYEQLTGWLTLKPFFNLTHETIYTVMITAEDLAGNQLVDNIWNFTTADRPEDYDADELPDWWEEKFFKSIEKYNKDSDPDSDKLLNWKEFELSTNPDNNDSDNDNLPDGWEVSYGLDPLNNTGDNGTYGDPDKDGLSNLEEYQQNSDPLEPPIKISDSKKPPDNDYTLIIIAAIIIILILIILALLVKKMRYKETGSIIKGGDDYLKTKDPDELGVGGKLLFEDSNNFKDREIKIKPEIERSITVDITTMKPGAMVKPTPAEILARAKEEQRKCPKCNAGLPSDTNYCFECGAILDEEK